MDDKLQNIRFREIQKEGQGLQTQTIVLGGERKAVEVFVRKELMFNSDGKMIGVRLS